MNADDAARRWAEVWTRAWPAKDVEAIVGLYADDASYRALAFREPARGAPGVRRYLKENFDAEERLECWFGAPVIRGDRAAVEWWGVWVENGEEITLAGSTLLRFDADGRVVDHRDYWNQLEGRRPPYPGW